MMSLLFSRFFKTKNTVAEIGVGWIKILARVLGAYTLEQYPEHIDVR
jgi:hypothetical protein